LEWAEAFSAPPDEYFLLLKNNFSDHRFFRSENYEHHGPSAFLPFDMLPVSAKRQHPTFPFSVALQQIPLMK